MNQVVHIMLWILLKFRKYFIPKVVNSSSVMMELEDKVEATSSVDIKYFLSSQPSVFVLTKSFQ